MGRVESQSQVTPLRPFWPPRGGEELSPLWTASLGKMHRGSEDREFPFGWAIREGFLKEVVLETDSEELVDFERGKWGRREGRWHELLCT